MQTMKVRKIITITSAVAVLGAGAFMLVPKNEPEYTYKAAEEQVAAKQTEPIKITKKPAREVASPKTEVVDIPPAPTTQPKEAQRKVLSTQEYGEKYLNLSLDIWQECFDKTVAAFPERFTEDVREQNVKALRYWATTCSSGINNPMSGVIYSFDFFDSDFAKPFK